MPDTISGNAAATSATRGAKRRPKQAFSSVEEGTIAAPIDEDEVEVFLSSLRQALNHDCTPSAQHIQVLLYLVCYGPPPPPRATDGRKIGTKGTDQDAATGSKTVTSDPEYARRVSAQALEVLDTLLSLHTAADIGRLIPHIQHDSTPPNSARTTFVPVSRGVRSTGGRGGRGRLSSGRSSDDRSSSPEKAQYASEMLGPVYSLDGLADDMSGYSTAEGSGRGRGKDRGRGRGGGRGRAASGQSATEEALPGVDRDAVEKAKVKAKRRRKTGLLFEADFHSDESDQGERDGVSGRPDRPVESHGVPAWLDWRPRTGRVTRETYRCMRAIWLAGGKGGAGIWPMLWAKAPADSEGVGAQEGGRQERSQSPADSLSSVSEDGDLADALKGDYGLSEGGWNLLAWLLRLWETDAKEEHARVKEVFGATDFDDLLHGTPSPVFLQQLPRYNDLKLADAPEVKQVLRHAFAGDGVQGTGLLRRDMKRQLGGRLFSMSCLPTVSSDPAFNPSTFLFDTITLLRPLSPSDAVQFLTQTCSKLPWTLRSHVLCLLIEDLAGVRADRNKARATGQRQDFARLQLGTGSSRTHSVIDFAPPRLDYLADLLTLTAPVTSSARAAPGSDVDMDPNADTSSVSQLSPSTSIVDSPGHKISMAKLAVLGLLVANRDKYRHKFDLLPSRTDETLLDEQWDDQTRASFAASGMSQMAKMAGPLMQSLLTGGIAR